MTDESKSAIIGALKATPAYWRIILLWCLVTGLVIPLAGQTSSPFHILTHEFTQLYAVISGIALYFLARWVVSKAGPEVETSSPLSTMRRSSFPMLIGIVVMGITTLVTMYLANALYWGCQFHRGVPFFVFTWIPVALWAVTGGILVGMSGWGRVRSTVVLLVIFLLSGAQDMLQGLYGTRYVDFIVGDLLAMDQRQGMAISEVHFFQRTFLMLVVFTLWNAGLWRFGGKWEGGGSDYRTELKQFRDKSVVACVILVAVALGWGSHIGLGWGNSALKKELSEVHTTDHFVFRYAPGGDTEINIDAIASGAEWYWFRLCSHWEVSPEKPVEVYVFDGTSIRRLTGISASHAVPNRMFLTYSAAVSPTLYHELVHALHQAAFDPKFRVWLNRGIVEGLAEAYEDELVWLPEAHRLRAGALITGTLPSATDFMSLFGFWKINETLAYDSAASFIGYLIYRYGVDRFREFQQHPDYERVFGRDLEALDTEWKAFLETVPVDAETEIRAGNYYEPAYWGAYSQENCPKLGKEHPSLEERARRLLQRGHYDRAFDLYSRLFETTDEVRWGYQMVLCLQNLQRFDDALAMLDDLDGRNDLTGLERTRLLRVRTSILLRLHDWQALYAAYDRRDSLGTAKPGEDQQILESLLRQPAVRSSVAEVLTTTDSYRQRQVLEELAGRYPENIEIQYLYASRALRTVYVRGGGAVITPEQESQIRLFLDYIEDTPGTADRYISVLLNYGRGSMQARNYELAEHITDALLRLCKDPLNLFRAEKLSERIDFDQESTGLHSDLEH